MEGGEGLGASKAVGKVGKMRKVWTVGKVWEQARLVIGARQCEEVDVTVMLGHLVWGRWGRWGGWGKSGSKAGDGSKTV